MKTNKHNDIETAIRCFQDSVTLFPDPDARPEQFQIHNGLLFMAKSLREVTEEMAELKHEIERLSAKSQEHPAVHNTEHKT